MINPEATKVILMVGTAESVIRIDLYEASTDDRKAELQHLILWMADNITTLTDRLKGSYNTEEDAEEEDAEEENVFIWGGK